MNTQAKQGVFDVINIELNRSKNTLRSILSLKIALRSIPRIAYMMQGPKGIYSYLK